MGKTIAELEIELDKHLDAWYVKLWIYITVIPVTIIALPLSILVMAVRYANNIAIVSEEFVSRRIKS